MKRYLITKQLISTIEKNKRSLREINNYVGFEIRNILYKNSTINEEHLRRLEDYFKRKFRLRRIYIDYGKNLPNSAITKPVKNIFKSKDMAEFIGIMLGDGNIWENRIRIAFDKRNTPYINYVFNLFKKIFELEFKKEISNSTNQFYLYCSNLFAVERLFELGLIRGNKIKEQVGIPDWIKLNKIYSKRCIRGLIDTDGCIYLSKRDKQTYIKFTNFNKRLLMDFKEVTSSLGYHFVKANKNNWCLYRKKEVVKFFKEIKPFKL